jgi:hypothetical protein
VLAAVGNTPYNIVLIIHILLAMVAFAPGFTHSILAGQSKGLPDAERRTFWGYMAGNSRRIYAPALILMGLAGFALSGMSDGIYALSKGWLIASILIWVAMNGILHAVLIPAERAVAGGDDSAAKRVDLGGALLTVGLLVMLYLMVFKPGQG